MVRGAAAGAVATWVMDLTTTGLQVQQSEADAARERAARPGGRSSVAILVDRILAATGIDADEPTRQQLAEVIHYGLGAGPGALYAVLRDRVPLLGARRGIVYGALLWALNDELLNTRLGLAGPPDAYPLSTHFRGLVGHVVLGVVTDALV